MKEACLTGRQSDIFGTRLADDVPTRFQVRHTSALVCDSVGSPSVRLENVRIIRQYLLRFYLGSSSTLENIVIGF